MAKLTAIIDADILIYSAAAGAQRTIDWGDGLDDPEPQADEQEGINLLNQSVKRLMEKTGADENIMCISCPSDLGWRKQVLPSYKENRAHITPPILRPILKQYVLDNFKSYAKDTLEGDDIYGILMTHPSIIPGQKIGVSMDKDMKTIPGLHYNTKRDEFFEITPKEADFWHMMQTLTGDITDGYKGCPGIGQVFAQEYLTKLLKPVPYQHEFKRGPRKGLFETRYRIERAESMWDVVRSLFEKAGLTEEDALIQAQVARICRHTDYDFKRKEVILWTP